MMLEVSEMEELLCNNDHNKLFKASQLLALLLALFGERTKNKLASFSDKISQRFKDEADALAEKLAKSGDNDGVLSMEIAEFANDWSQQLKQMFQVIADRLVRHQDRYVLIDLSLNMVAALQPLSNVDKLLHQLAQLLLLDLEEKQLSRDRSGLRGFLVCVNKFSSMDQQTYAGLLEAMKEHFVESTGCEDCLEIFLEEAEYLPPPIADKLFNKAVLAFDSQKSSNKILKFFQGIPKFLGYGAGSKTDNLTRLFSHCLREIQLDGLDTAGIIEAVSRQATVANMMRFYPQLAKLNKLEREIRRRADTILEAVTGFSFELDLGSLSLHTLGLLLSDDARVERLIALHECVTEQAFSTGELKGLIRRRLAELAAYNRAADTVKKFTAKFDVTEGSQTIGAMLAQFEVDPATVELRQVCTPLEAMGRPIVLKLRTVSAEELATLEQHNRLYESAVFRIIHDEVWEASER